jgi:hypothetical protein
MSSTITNLLSLFVPQASRIRLEGLVFCLAITLVVGVGLISTPSFSNTMNVKPIAYVVGDDTVAFVGKALREHLGFPCTLIDMSVENRVSTKDGCIKEAVVAIKNCGAGFKESTASDRSKQYNQASANIVLRPATGAYAMERILTLPNKYQNVCGVMRYGHGGIYDVLDGDLFFPQHNVVRGIYPEGHQLQGEEYIIEPVITNLSGLELIAVKAVEVAHQHGLRLFVSSKWTICQSEKLFLEMISRKWTEMGVQFLDDKNVQEHQAAVNFRRKLTDIMEAEMTLAHMSEGGFLAVMPNAPGDSGSDIVDLQDGSRSMSSKVHCRGNFSGSGFQLTGRVELYWLINNLRWI